MRTDEMRRIFAREYLVDLNGAQAAIRAGYAPRSARQQASRLLKYADVQAYIREERAAREARTDLQQDAILEELRAIAMAPASDAKGSDLRYASKLRALELLGKHLGLWEERPSVSVSVTAETADLAALSDEELRRLLADGG